MKTNKGLRYLVATDDDGKITEVTRLSDNVTFEKGDRVRTPNGTVDTIKGFTLYEKKSGVVITVSLNPTFDAGYYIDVINKVNKEYEDGFNAGYRAGLKAAQDALNNL